MGTTDDSVLTKFMADNQYTYDYVDHTADPFSDIKHVDSATLIATNVNVADSTEMTGLTVFDMGSIVVEKDQLGNNKAIVRGGTVSGEIGLANVSGKSLTWDAKTGIGSLALFTGAHEENSLTVGDAMLAGKVVNGTAQVKVQNAEEVMPGFFLNKDMQRIYDEHLFDAASSDAQIAMLTQFSQAVNGMTSLGEIKAASQALEEGSNSAVLGGAYNAALDAGEQFNKALDRRMTVATVLTVPKALPSGLMSSVLPTRPRSSTATLATTSTSTAVSWAATTRLLSMTPRSVRLSRSVPVPAAPRVRPPRLTTTLTSWASLSTATSAARS